MSLASQEHGKYIPDESQITKEIHNMPGAMKMDDRKMQDQILELIFLLTNTNAADAAVNV